MDFNIISPMVVTDTELTASNIPEDDAPEWDGATEISKGAYRISTITHRIYESMQDGNINHNPVGDDGTWWLDLRATNRWSAFDNRRSNQASRADEITYSITPTMDCDAISLFGLLAGSVRIEVWDGATKIYDETFVMVDKGRVTGPYTWFWGGIVYARQKVLNGFPGYVGHRIDVTISAPGAVAKVGHIVMGKNHLLGKIVGTVDAEHVSHSRKEYDDYGDEVMLKRGSTRKLTIPIAVPTIQGPRVMSIVDEVDGLVTAFYGSPTGADFGVEGLGFVDGHTQPLDAGEDAVFTIVMKTIK